MISKLTIVFLGLCMLGSAGMQPQARPRLAASPASGRTIPAMLTVCAGPMALEVFTRDGKPVLVSYGNPVCDGVSIISLHLHPAPSGGSQTLPVRTR